MIRETQGNLLTAPVEALVNTVNTVGVMGKGIALQFKRAFPRMYEEYVRAAKGGELVPGRVQVWESDLLDGPKFVINFPTKRHWRGPSKLEYIDRGLDDLARVITEHRHQVNRCATSGMRQWRAELGRRSTPHRAEVGPP